MNDLRAAIDRADELPEDAETPILRELSVSEAFNILMVAVSDVGGVGEFRPCERSRATCRRSSSDLPGLRHASMRGDRERELRVLVDKNRALQYDLTLPEIIGIVTSNNQNFAGGSFTNRRFTGDHGSRARQLRVGRGSRGDGREEEPRRQPRAPAGRGRDRRRLREAADDRPLQRSPDHHARDLEGERYRHHRSGRGGRRNSSSSTPRICRRASRRS